MDRANRFGMIHDTTEAEDLTQETFLRAYHRRDSLQAAGAQLPGCTGLPRMFVLTACASMVLTVTWEYRKPISSRSIGLSMIFIHPDGAQLSPTWLSRII